MQGFELVPITLEVGDYILTPDICIERKSLSDLIGSFASGRLFNQVESMCRTYATVILLIEFDVDRPFSLQSPSEIRDEIDRTSPMSKLVLLLLHFPRLRVIWCHGSHSTSSVFRLLKDGKSEPVPTDIQQR
jgi:DNA excision repair protein ERCC-4